MGYEKLRKPTYTIRETAEILGTSARTVVRMLDDHRLEGDLIDTPRGEVWMVDPLSIAKLVVRKEDLERKRYLKK